MFKIAGIFIVMTAASIMGLKKRSTLYMRLKLLRETQSAVCAAEAKLRCMRIPLDECFDSCGSVFTEASLNIRNGMLPSEAIKNAVDSESFFNENDRDVLYEFSNGLSADDCEGQISNFRLLSERLKPLIKNASDEAAKKGRLVLEGSILAAAAIILIIL